jgi:hypothetical protein
MSNCKFEKQLNDSPEQLLAKAKKEIARFGGTITGDNSKGSFTIPTFLGPLSGNYSIKAETITIQVTEKPIVISCGVIENKLDEYLQNDFSDVRESLEIKNAPEAASNPNRDYIHWGDWKKDECSGQGTRQYSSIIWGLDRYPKDQWIGMCYSQPINNIPGQSFNGPNRCKWDTWGHVWGEVDVPDTSCGYVPTPGDGDLSTCRIRTITTETKPQQNERPVRNDIEFFVELYRDNADHKCPPNTPLYTMERDIKVIIQTIDSTAGTWKYFDPIGGVKIMPNFSKVELPFGTHPSVQFHYRPNDYQPGNYYFHIWLRINGVERFFKEGGWFTIQDGKIHINGKI